MKLANCVFLACFGLISLISVSTADGSANSTDFLPSQIDLLSCPGQANCTGEQCNFNKTSHENTTRPFFSDVGIQIKCKDMIVRVNFPQNRDPVYQGQDNYTCFIYKNGNGTTFNVAELTLSEPTDVNSTQVTCTADNSSCTLRSEKNSVLLFVAGLPSTCVPWSPPSPSVTTSPTTSPTGQSTSSPKSDSTTTPVSNVTGNATTGSPGEPTPAPTVAPTPGGKPGAPTEKPKDGGNNVGGAIVLVLGAALFARHCV